MPFFEHIQQVDGGGGNVRARPVNRGDARIGEAGGRVHLGRSRNDQVLVALRLYLRDAIDDIRVLLGQFQDNLLDLAEREAATPMPGFTLLNPMEGDPHARFLAYRGDAAASLQTQLANANVITDVRGDVLRIGFGLYHDEEDVDRLVKIVTKCAKTTGD